MSGLQRSYWFTNEFKLKPGPSMDSFQLYLLIPIIRFDCVEHFVVVGMNELLNIHRFPKSLGKNA